MFRALAILLAAAPLLVAAFPWGEMCRHANWDRVLWIPFFSGYRARDAVLNSLVTVPIGLTAAAVARRRPMATALAVAAVVSVGCELAQVYASGRFPSGTDVFSNTVGAAAGVFLLKALRTPQSPQKED